MAYCSSIAFVTQQHPFNRIGDTMRVYQIISRNNFNNAILNVESEHGSLAEAIDELLGLLAKKRCACGQVVQS